jgi:hypothetical protein
MGKEKKGSGRKKRGQTGKKGGKKGSNANYREEKRGQTQIIKIWRKKGVKRKL